jgi:hypothetical protein
VIEGLDDLKIVPFFKASVKLGVALSESANLLSSD